jgi:hypothetical protein
MVFIDSSEFELFMESVEWPGVWNAWLYAKQLRQVVCRLAALRLRSCHQFAQEIATSQLIEIHNVTSQYLQNDLEEVQSSVQNGLEYRPHGSILELAELSLLDSSDKFEMAKDYMPSVSMVGVSFLTYRSLVTGILRGSAPSFHRLGKLVCAGVALVGILS